MVALAVLALRHHRLEVTSETVRIHDEILARRQTLLDQRVAIARGTNPWALAAGLKAAGMETGEAMVSRTTAQSAAPGPVIPSVETDLVAPLMSRSRGANSGGADAGGHSNPNRPHD